MKIDKEKDSESMCTTVDVVGLSSFSLARDRVSILGEYILRSETREYLLAYLS